MVGGKSSDMEKSANKITEATLLSIHVVIVLVGLTVWLTKLSFHLEQHEKDMKRLEARCDEKRAVSDRVN
jgi:hypothetical protein